jgi:hypothetical protein
MVQDAMRITHDVPRSWGSRHPYPNRQRGTLMNNTTLTLAIVLLCGSLCACKPDTPAPAADAGAAAPTAEPAAAAPMATEPAPPATTDAMPPAPATAADASDDDTPHSGGDKVAPAAATATPTPPAAPKN